MLCLYPSVGCRSVPPSAPRLPPLDSRSVVWAVLVCLPPALCVSCRETKQKRGPAVLSGPLERDKAKEGKRGDRNSRLKLDKEKERV